MLHHGVSHNEYKEGYQHDSDSGFADYVAVLLGHRSVASDSVQAYDSDNGFFHFATYCCDTYQNGPHGPGIAHCHPDYRNYPGRSP
ncbi:hypothetical protein Hanom_Chr00s156632g01823831 [Helianthus anomalus]